MAITIDEAIEWGRRGELCDLMTEADQRQVADWLDEMRWLVTEAIDYYSKPGGAHSYARAGEIMRRAVELDVGPAWLTEAVDE